MSATEAGAMGAVGAVVLALLNRAHKLVQDRHKPDGYDIGVNIGAAAGKALPR
jgi:diadenosine tetraphosphate (Ap4A) HIT family hydrolase